MESNLNFVTDLSLIFISAGLITLLAKWLKQPLILGYIVAGFLVGPHTPLGISLTSQGDVSQWAEIGIIFLLFALGLEFSFKKLLNVGSSALITAFTIFIGMFTAGLIIGSLLGWTTMSSVFLGGMLSMSSTTIIIKAYDDMGLKKAPYSGLIFGTLVVEDMFAILLMVMLSTAAVSKHFEGTEMLMNFGKLAFFLILWFLIGIYLIPSLFRRAKRIMNEEMLLILSVGLCFGMVVFANVAGFSSALGAFVMGSILAETAENEQITESLKPVKNLFGAVFFVSVGMMVDPTVIVTYWKTILILILVVVIFLPIFSASGVLMSRKGLSSAVHIGLSMAQIGEFAFIIAALGCKFKVLDDYVYPVMVSVSVITTFFTPYFIKFADPAEQWLKNHLPEKMLTALTPDIASEKKGVRPGAWKKLLRSYVLRIVLHSVILIAILSAADMFLYPHIQQFEDLWKSNELITTWFCIITTLAAMSPFIIGLVRRTHAMEEAYQKLWNDSSRPNKGPLIALTVLRLFIALSFVSAVFLTFFPENGWTLMMVLAAMALLVWLSRRDIKTLQTVESTFLKNLRLKEEMERKKKPLTTSLRDKLSNHDIHIESVYVSPDSHYAGMRLGDIPIRKEYGVNIVKIVRGHREIPIPSADEYIYPMDKVLLLGNEAQLKRFIAALAELEARTPVETTPISIDPYTLDEESMLTGKALHDTDLRSAGCMVIGIERGGESFMNPSPDFVFAAGDIVWMVGAKDACEKFA